MMSAEPPAVPVTVPSCCTVATDTELLLYAGATAVTGLSRRSVIVTVVDSVKPTVMDAACGVRMMCVGAPTATVTKEESDTPVDAVATIQVVPGATAIAWSTPAVTTAGFRLVTVTLAGLGTIRPPRILPVTTNAAVSPGTIVNGATRLTPVRSSETTVTSCVTAMLDVATQRTVTVALP